MCMVLKRLIKVSHGIFGTAEMGHGLEKFGKHCVNVCVEVSAPHTMVDKYIWCISIKCE